MENKGFGSTLTGGIQEVSAILPILGTEQCERHVGSALRGGYLYAASTPLSMFGCLGIVKVGISVLIASISIPKFWISYHDLRPSGPQGKAKQSMFFGSKMLEDAGFKLQGDVASLIGMDGTRFKAETKLIEILEEKHVDDPRHVQIKWKSKQWNLMLILFTIVAAAMSGIPYFALLLGPTSWRPTTDLRWLFPFLRTAGSCIAAVCCQFIIQSRVISAMKNRLLFMDIHRRFVDGLSRNNKVNLDDWLKYHIQWDSDLPAERCIWNLEKVLSFYGDLWNIQDDDDVEPAHGHISIEMEKESTLPALLPPPRPLFGTSPHHNLNQHDLGVFRHKHFPSPTRDRVFAFISWIFLLLSLPATVAGYIGCFTLVSSIPSQGNGPLVWLGLEAALSVIRILVWAWNPTFDEDTDVTVEQEFISHPPFDWSTELHSFIHDLENEKSKPLSLVPERRFLEGVAAYCGPLDQFRSSENIALYFTLMINNASKIKESRIKHITLLMTIFNFNTRIGVVLFQLGGVFYYFDADVQYEAAFSEINSTLHSTMRNIHPWQRQAGTLFSSLENHYTSLVHALNRSRWDVAKFGMEWNLSSFKPTLTARPSLAPQSLGHESDPLYPDQSYHDRLKTSLIELWSRWIIHGMKKRADDARNDCYEALEDESSEKEIWELTERDRLVAWEWAKREQILIACSLELKDALRVKMEKRIAQVGEEREGRRLEAGIRSLFEITWSNRLEKERGEAERRMTEAMVNASRLAEEERRLWQEQGRFAPKWQEGMELVDKLWSEAISRGPAALENAESELENLARVDVPVDAEDTTRDDFVGQVKKRFSHWHTQRENERSEMEATINRIGIVDGVTEQLAYKHYPEPDNEAPFKFSYLGESSSKGKACSAIVYDAVLECPAEVVRDVVKKSTTRSVVNVDPEIVASIPPNDHLLFLSCKGGGEEPAFVQRNRDQWWSQQTTNAALFYFTPKFAAGGSACFVKSGSIAQILIFLTTPSRVRLRLLHRANHTRCRLDIQQKGENIFTLSDGIPEDNFKLQALELEELGPGRHELQLVVADVPGGGFGLYYLRDIHIEFLDDPTPENSSTSVHLDPSSEVRPTLAAEHDAEAETESSKSQDRSASPPLEADIQREDHTATPTPIIDEDNAATALDA